MSKQEVAKELVVSALEDFDESVASLGDDLKDVLNDLKSVRKAVKAWIKEIEDAKWLGINGGDYQVPGSCSEGYGAS